ncbi:hypothetical protein FS749_007323 [Ceratobasidium sp. UAMH 11750]|nr:hypothetical protein FS749_007323 [Ceratobasidium sp. UAMH 11750]
MSFHTFSLHDPPMQATSPPPPAHPSAPSPAHSTPMSISLSPLPHSSSLRNILDSGAPAGGLAQLPPAAQGPLTGDYVPQSFAPSSNVVSPVHSQSWDCESPLPAELSGLGPRLPSANSQWADPFLPPRSRIRPRMRPVPVDDDDDELPEPRLLFGGQPTHQSNPALSHLADIALAQYHGVPPQSGISGPVLEAPFYPAAARPQPPVDISRLSQPIDFILPSQSTPGAQSQPAVPPAGQPSASGGHVAVIEIPSSPAPSTGTIDLITPSPASHASTPAAPASPSPAPTPTRGRKAKGKQVDPGERAAPKPKPSAKATPRSSNKKPAKGKSTSKKGARERSESERAALDVPLEASSDSDAGSAMEVEMDPEAGPGLGSSRTTNRISDDIKFQILTYWFDPETYAQHRKEQPKYINELLLLLRGAIKKKTLEDFLRRQRTKYFLYHRLIMKTGGGKDDRVSQEEFERRHAAFGTENTLEYWMGYGDSREFDIIHNVLWDAEEVCKYRHMDSVTSTSSDNDALTGSTPDDDAGSSNFAKGAKKSRKRRHEGSGSETERESTRRGTKKDTQVIALISTGVNDLVVSRERGTDILERQLELEIRKEAREQHTQDAKLALETRSSQISDFIKLSGLVGNANPVVAAHAEKLLGQLDMNLVSLPAPYVPAPPAPNNPTVSVPLASGTHGVSAPPAPEGPAIITPQAHVAEGERDSTPVAGPSSRPIP